MKIQITVPDKIIPYMNQLFETGAYGTELVETAEILLMERLRELMREDEIIKLEDPKSERDCKIRKNND